LDASERISAKSRICDESNDRRNGTTSLPIDATVNKECQFPSCLMEEAKVVAKGSQKEWLEALDLCMPTSILQFLAPEETRLTLS